jgi:hypothetical protein
LFLYLKLFAGDHAAKDELEALIQQQREKAAEVLAAATDPNRGPHNQVRTEAATKASKYGPIIFSFQYVLNSFSVMFSQSSLPKSNPLLSALLLNERQTRR